MKTKTRIKVSVLMLILNTYVVFNSFAQVPLVYEVENTGASCTAPPLLAVNQLPVYAMLPDPFSWSDGSGRISSFDDWKCRRNEIKQEIEKYEIGIKPPKPANITASYSGGTLTVNVTENGQTLTLTSSVTMPTGSGPFPVVIGMNAPTGQLPANLFNGVIQIPFNHDQVARYTQGTRDASYPFFKLYPNLTSNGYYSAWSWGISRLIDGIEIVKSQMNADTKRIAVTGCSYAGKMALFAGAFDERIALTIAQESGGGGVNAWRVSETIGNVEKIDNTNYSWFMQSMQSIDPTRLPHDHHELMAMIAPRALLVLGNPPFEWLGDESGYVSSRAAHEVWKAMGVPDRFGFSFRSGHDHCQLPSASDSEVTAFVDKFLKGNANANTDVLVHSFNSTDYNRWIDTWKDHVLTTADPNAPKVTLTSPAAGTSPEAPASIQLEADVADANNDVSKVEFYNGTTKLGEDATSPYTLSLTDLEVGTYTFTAKATDTENLTGTSATVTINVIAPPFKIHKTSAPPIIDGIVDTEWENPNIEAVQAVNTIVGTVTDDNDLSGSAKFLWDNTYLYVFATITDDSKQNDSQNSYEDDAVEIYLDINNDKATTYGANDVQYSFGWDDGAVVGALPSGRSTSGIIYSAVNTTNGYVVEARIPWLTVQGSPAENQLVGIEFMINDDDNGGTRDKKLSWTSTTDNAWQDASLFGVAKLAGELIITDIDAINSSAMSEIRCFPNPFNSTLTIEAKGDFSYQLINQLGQVIDSENSINTIVLEKEYPKGIYLLKVTQEYKSSIIKLVKE